MQTGSWTFCISIKELRIIITHTIFCIAKQCAKRALHENIGIRICSLLGGMLEVTVKGIALICIAEFCFWFKHILFKRKGLGVA